ncbi:hypothetical protein DB346_00365 [Verrucomicrobia bacterium LW23]|nr:hypothetical protein DB346_00365 [Verrucomicrobia bacterium LW23]
MEFFLIGLVAIGVGTVIWPYVAKTSAPWAGWLSAVAPAAIFLWLLTQAGPIAKGEIPSWSGQWVPQLNVALSFRLDGLGLLLSLLISGIGFLILIYGGAYLKGSPHAVPFFVYIQLFMLAMLGVASSGHLLVLFIFWELTSLASYLLIGLSHSELKARKAALRALFVTGAGGLALMAGILLLGLAGGSFDLHILQQNGDAVRNSPLYPAIFVLVIFGTFTKSAQVPFHFWLPDAMAAPTPVSAYLHSATMVKAGIFLLAKLFPVLGGTAVWHDTLTLTGAATMLLGAVLALAQTDLKRLLAYSTMSALGTLVMLLGIGTELAVTAAMLFLVVHALYKAPLFMIAGVVDKAAGTRDITQLDGLGCQMPFLAGAAALAAFSMSGIPPFIGFIGKELLYEAEINAGGYAVLVTCLGFAANAINVTVALKVGISPFRHRGRLREINPKARNLTLLIGPILLAVAGTIVGIFPAILGDGLIHAAVRDVTRHEPHVHLKLWHGFNWVLALSAVTVAVGVILYIFRDTVRALARVAVHCFPATASEMFDATLAAIIRLSASITRWIQHGNLRLYVAVVLVCLCGLVIAALASTPWTLAVPGSAVRLVPMGIALLIVVSGITAIQSHSTVMAVLAMGGVGLGVALLFAFFGAPDLALTQLLVEILTLVLCALVFRQLPAIRAISSASERNIDLILSAVAGAAVTIALLAVRSAPALDSGRVSADMAAKSLPEANGMNVVNVILVDFRALDTLGEIAVLAIAGMGVAALLLGSGRRDLRAELAIATPLFRTSVTWLTPLLLFMSVVLLFRGHNEPGGGFTGGLLAASALLLKRLAESDRPLHGNRTPLLLIAGGLSAAAISAVPALFFQKTFMSGFWLEGSVWLPFVGKTKFGTPFLFDVGVYFVVIGVCLLILTRLLRTEEPRKVRVA